MAAATITASRTVSTSLFVVETQQKSAEALLAVDLDHIHEHVFQIVSARRRVRAQSEPKGLVGCHLPRQHAEGSASLCRAARDVG
eukprot:1906339-Pleurochrysis_carterae.AAC.2